MIKELITHLDPKSPISEVFRSLRTNIQFMNSKLDTLLITSTMQAEGKSWTTANLAATFAQAGKKVIIVDADMRKGRQYGIFGVAPRPGLSNFLSGIDENGRETDKGILNYIRETDVENLFVIPAGNVPPNPSELLVSDKMQELITSLREICDLVIFDGTPSLLVTDSVILSRLVDSTIIVTSYKETKMDNLQKIKKDIENVGGKVSGVIINRVPISQKKYENTYYYGSSSSGAHKPLRKATTNNNKSKISDLQKKTVNNTQIKTKLSENENNLATLRAKAIKEIDKKETEQKSEIRLADNIKLENGQVSVEKTAELLNKINTYLEAEKGKLNNK